MMVKGLVCDNSIVGCGYRLSTFYQKQHFKNFDFQTFHSKWQCWKCKV